MKKYLWINPVVYDQYPKRFLVEFADKYNFILVQPKANAAETVRRKVEKVVRESQRVVIDTRCPMAVQVLQKKYPDFLLAPVEPILIHIARELSDSSELKDGEKWIITPCQALADAGTELKLENTKFMTWLHLLQMCPFEIQPQQLESSPIPPGFFKSIGVKQVSLTGNELFQRLPSDVQLIEALYCPLGCHKGDGVQHEP